MIEEIANTLPDEILDFSWSLQSNLTTASYPMLDSKDDMRTLFVKRINHSDDRLLACYEGGALVGVLCLYVIKEDNYLQSNGIYVDCYHQYVYNEFIAYLHERYHGYTIYLGYPKENESAQKTVNDFGAERVDSSVRTLLQKNDLIGCASDINVYPVSNDSYEAFAAFYDRHTPPDMSWTSAKLKEKLDDWRIYVVKEQDIIVGCITYSVWDSKEAEIFCLALKDEYVDNAYPLALLAKSMPDIFAAGKSSVLFIIDDVEQEMLAAATRLGFKVTGSYVCYKYSF